MKHKYYAYVIIVTVLLAGIAWIEGRNETTGETDVVVRSEPGEGSRDISLEMEVPGMQESYTYELSLEERSYTKQECEELFEKAIQEIEEGFAAKGETVSHITRDVNLADSLQNGQVSVEWDLGLTGAILPDGSIDASKVTEAGTIVQVSATLKYKEQEYMYEFPVCVYPGKVDEISELVEKVDLYFKEKNSEKKDVPKVPLPAELAGYKLNWSTPQSNTPFVILGLGAISLGVVPLCIREQERKKLSERRYRIEMEYPGMLAEFVLLLGAGMTVRLVWGKLVENYERQLHEGKRCKSDLYEEMIHTQRHIQDGIGEANAYEEFAMRCEIACCRRFSMLLIQYLTKGNRGLIETLELEAGQAFEERKSIAKRRGEEAGTKLLLPMLLMLMVVMVIMLVPACMTMEI